MQPTRSKGDYRGWFFRNKSNLNKWRLYPNHAFGLMGLAILAGFFGGYAAVALRLLIEWIQFLLLGFGSERILSHITAIPAWRILLAPVIGGILVGWLRHHFLQGRRSGGPTDVIAGASVRGGFMSLRHGLSSVLVNGLSVGCGASVGREGPAVHFGATLSSVLGQVLRLEQAQCRTLLGCGVAAAVAASFNAPMAGGLFALEVVIGSYAISSFMPIMLAAVTGTVIARFYYGDLPAFILPPYEITSLYEFPAFALLGGCSAVLAVLLILGIEFSRDYLVPHLPGPSWLAPAFSGLVVGVLALIFPQILGTSYETTDLALASALPFFLLCALIAAKLFATSICLGSGFGGGVFSPSLCLGAMLGSAFGTAATGFLPHLSSGEGAYAIVGMAAVAGAVLGAPISTILMIFELYGKVDIALAVLLATSLASALTNQFTGCSFFYRQLQAEGIDLSDGLEEIHMRTHRVAEIMHQKAETVSPDSHSAEILDHLHQTPTGSLYVVDERGQLIGIINLRDISYCLQNQELDPDVTAAALIHPDHPITTPDTSLREALQLMEQSRYSELPVVASDSNRKLLGFVCEIDVLRVHNHAVREARAQERGTTL